MRTFIYVAAMTTLGGTGAAYANCGLPTALSHGVRVACAAPAPEMGAGLLSGLAILAGLAAAGSITVLQSRKAN